MEFSTQGEIKIHSPLPCPKQKERLRKLAVQCSQLHSVLPKRFQKIQEGKTQMCNHVKISRSSLAVWALLWMNMSKPGRWKGFSDRHSWKRSHCPQISCLRHWANPLTKQWVSREGRYGRNTGKKGSNSWLCKVWSGRSWEAGGEHKGGIGLRQNKKEATATRQKTDSIFLHC